MHFKSISTQIYVYIYRQIHTLAPWRHKKHHQRNGKSKIKSRINMSSRVCYSWFWRFICRRVNVKCFVWTNNIRNVRRYTSKKKHIKRDLRWIENIFIIFFVWGCVCVYEYEYHDTKFVTFSKLYFPFFNSGVTKLSIRLHTQISFITSRLAPVSINRLLAPSESL